MSASPFFVSEFNAVQPVIAGASYRLRGVGTVPGCVDLSRYALAKA